MPHPVRPERLCSLTSAQARCSREHGRGGGSGGEEEEEQEVIIPMRGGAEGGGEERTDETFEAPADMLL